MGVMQRLSVAKTGGSLRGGGAVLLGDKELTRKLDHLSKSGSKRAIVSGIRASMTPIAKAMRAAINATDASPSLKREARKTIGTRFAKAYKRDVREAKVGFAVGKKKKTIQRAVEARGKRIEAGKSSGSGVGISAANIHWFVLGTDERHHKSGHPTGQIANIFGGVTRLALAGSAAASLAAARRKIKQVIEREARKKG
jgi:hypothetical protein